MRVAIGELGIQEMYAYYIEHTPEPLSLKEYKKVIKEYLKEVLDLIIDKAHNFKLPNRLGYWRIQKRQFDSEQLSVDWKTSKEIGKRVYHLNPHSDGFKIRFLWEKKLAVLKKHMKRPYSFTLCRDMKRRLALNMKLPNGHSKYAEEITHI